LTMRASLLGFPLCRATVRWSWPPSPFRTMDRPARSRWRARLPRSVWQGARALLLLED
jgi:hypothetical protein